LEKRTPQDRARLAVIAVLPRPARVRAGRHQDGHSVDLTVNGVPIEIKWIGEGGLRQVRTLLAGGPRLPGIVVARRLSPGAREALTLAGVGWVDETGAAEVSLPALVISRSGYLERPRQREPRWTSTVLSVAEALLCGTGATVSATQEATGLSAGGCAAALRTLTDLGLLTARAPRGRSSGRRLDDPDRLLDAFATAANAVPAKAGIRVGMAWRDPISHLVEIGRSWTHAQRPWAVTGALAASVLAPYLTSVHSADVYVDADTHPGLEAVAAEAGLRPVDGGRLTLHPFPTVTARRLATVQDGLYLAPWPRVYADLRETGVRGEEAAEHLREVVRGP
jgi:hypothetical protein